MTSEPTARHAIVAKIAAIENDMQLTDSSQVSRYNRLFKQQQDQLDKIVQNPAREELTLQLLTHPDPHVRMTTAHRCSWDGYMVAEAKRAVLQLATRTDKLGQSAALWLEDRSRMAWARPVQAEVKKKVLPFLPAPKVYSRAEALQLVTARFPGARGDSLAALLKPAIRLWPVKARRDTQASSLGGMPRLPRGMKWPTSEDEPLLFLARIDCAEVHAAVGETALPETGALLFFGHPDDLCGAGPMGGGVVFHLADDTGLKTRRAPIEDFVVVAHCGLEFIATMDLPDLKSSTFEALGLSAEEEMLYAKLRREMRNGGAPLPDDDDYATHMLGWADMIQDDWWGDAAAGETPSEILLQIGTYHDGAEWNDLGPGGMIYFMIEADALAGRRFDEVEMVTQCT